MPSTLQVSTKLDLFPVHLELNSTEFGGNSQCLRLVFLNSIKRSDHGSLSIISVKLGSYSYVFNCCIVHIVDLYKSAVIFKL